MCTESEIQGLKAQEAKDLAIFRQGVSILKDYLLIRYTGAV